MTQNALKQIDILLVDDNAGDRRLIMLALNHCSHMVTFDVETAETLGQAREKLLQSRPDIVLLDLGLPDSNGLETVTKVKEVAGGVPVVVLTGLMDEEMGLETIKNGAEDYIVKGKFTEDSLTRMIRYVIERKRANDAMAEAQCRFEMVIEHAPFIAVMGLSRDGCIRHWNPAAESLYGYSRSHAIAINVKDLLPDAEQAMQISLLLADIWDTKKPSPPGEWTVVTRTGEIRTVLSSMFPIVNQGQCVEIFCMDVDITDRKLAEDQLKKANLQLTEQDRMKNDFVMTITHELRTPLTIFKNVISNALAGAMGKLGDKLRKNLIMADEAVDRLATIVSDFFDIAKIDAGKVKLAPSEFCIASLATDISELFRPTADKRGINIETVLPRRQILVTADRGRIAQVFNNLIGNALKFVPEGYGRIRIILDEIDGEVSVEVIDNGPGIPGKNIERIFNRFVQAGKQVGAGAHGTGLGLAICKEFVSLHGGRIGVQNHPDGGARFMFVIPKVFAGKVEEEVREAVAVQTTS